MDASGVDGRRVVQVIALGASGSRVLGSGYLTGGGLALTAAHVVRGARSVTVRRVLGPGRLAEAGAQVAWIDPDGLTDLAVLRVSAGEEQAGAFPVDLAPVRLGRVVGPAQCEAVGFPLFKLRSPQPGLASGARAVYRDTHHARGMTTPLSDGYGGTLEVTVEPPREDPDPQASPWAGMSGAALLADGVLVGLVCEHHRAEGANRITARRAESWYELDPAAMAGLRELLELPGPQDLTPVGVPGSGDGYWQGCPYLGLVPYGTADVQVFYGREEMTGRLHRRVLDHARGGLLVVTGPSGAGKSSLLHAGLVPALNAGALREQTRSWPCLVITPTSQPLRELAGALAELVGRPARELADMLAVNPERTGQLVARALARRGGAGRERLDAGLGPRLVLVVDQFEELFTRTGADQAGRQEREGFVAALHALTVPQPDQPAVGPGVVAVAVRGDFTDRLLEFELLAAAYEAGPFVVRAMTPAELARAVTGPAAEAGLSVEPELVEALVREAHGRADPLALDGGVLPLVSEVMARTWERREGRVLTARAYRRAGGLDNAVDQAADEVFQALSPPLREVARAVFLRLTLVAADGRITRRDVPRSELHQDGAGTAQQVDEVIERFVGRRLLVRMEQDRVQIAHEVLPRAWAALQGWLQGDRVDQAVYGQLIIDAQAWEQHELDPGYLYAGGRLGQVAAVQQRWGQAPHRYPSLPPAAVAFLSAGHAAERRRFSRRRRVTASLIALALGASGAALYAGIAAQNARREATALRAENVVALSRQLTAEALSLNATDPYAARQLSAAAWTLSPTDEVGQGAATLLNGQAGTLIAPDDIAPGDGEPARSVAFNSAGTILATADGDGTVRLWDPTTQQKIGTTITVDTNSADDSMGDGVFGVAFNPAGTILATADGDGTVRLWDPTTQQKIGTTTDDTDDTDDTKDDSVFGVAFNPAGTILATVDGDGTVRLWDPTTQQKIGTITDDTDDDGVAGVAFNPAGTILATADDDGNVQLWDPTTQKQFGITTTITAAAPSDELGYGDAVAFNPAGTILATAEAYGTVQLWNPATQQQIGATITAGGKYDGIAGVAFNPAGTILATADSGGPVRLWDPATQQQIGATMTAGGKYDGVIGVAFNPAGTILATADEHGTVQLWNPATQQKIGTIITTTTSKNRDVGAAFNPAGAILATADGDGTVQLWNPTTQQQIGTTITTDTKGAGNGTGIGPSNGVGDGVVDVAFNPAGTILATTDGEGNVQLWNPTTQQQIGTTITTDTKDHGNDVADVAFNPAGTILATTDGDGLVKLINVSSQVDAGQFLCRDFGLPSASTWSQYAGTSIAEPKQCP